MELQKISNDGIYEVICGQGYQTILLLQADKHETHLELSLLEFADGNYDLSVLRMHTALERFFRYGLRYLTVLKGADLDTFKSLKDEQDKTLKLSERLIGGFLSAFIFERLTSETVWLNPKSLTAWQGLRNKIIHDAFIPTKADCLKNNQEILDFIVKTRRIMRQSSNEHLHKLDAFDLIIRSEEANAKIKNDLFGVVGTIGSNFAITESANADEAVTFEELSSRAFEKQRRLEEAEIELRKL